LGWRSYKFPTKIWLKKTLLRPLFCSPNFLNIPINNLVNSIRAVGRESAAHPAFTLGHRVLIGEKSVVGFELDLMPLAHGAGKQRRTKFSCQTRGNRVSEEEPGVGAIPGARTLNRHRHRKGRADIFESGHILLPAIFIEVDRQKVALFILAQGIDAGNEFSPQMGFYDLFIQGGI